MRGKTGDFLKLHRVNEAPESIAGFAADHFFLEGRLSTIRGPTTFSAVLRMRLGSEEEGVGEGDGHFHPAVWSSVGYI